LAAGFKSELEHRFFLLLIILGATDKRSPQGFAPIAIGLGLTLIHLIGIPVTNLSVNPARSTGRPSRFEWLGSLIRIQSDRHKTAIDSKQRPVRPKRRR
jgi:glycerol uptake facilitator-like aquaporin